MDSGMNSQALQSMIKITNGGITMKKITITIVAAIALLGFATRDANAWLLFGSTDPSLIPVLQNAFLKYQRQPKLAEGMADASAYSAHAATQRGYVGYDKVCITVGTMAAAQVPATTTDLGYYKKLGENLMKQGDLNIGVAWNAWSLNVGVKLPLDFYLTGKFGYLKYRYEDYDFDGIHGGAMLNYQIVKPKSPEVKFVLWRGISVGTGLLYQRNKTTIHHTADPISSAGYTFKPILDIKVTTESYVIPVEISTAVRLIWVLNIHAGGGIDFADGTSDIRYSAVGVADGPGVPALFSVYGRQSGKGSKHYMPKIFCGPGLNFGPVIIDIPFTYYFMNGFNVGVTFGVVF
jgi:hypothetical protein